MLFRRYLQALVAVGLMVATASAGDPGCGVAVEPGCDAQPVMVEKVVCVPEWGTEKRTITTTEYTQEPVTKTITCYRRVAETKQVTEDVTIMVPETRTKRVTYTVRKPVYETKTCQVPVRVPVYNDVPQQYTVCVPVYNLVEKTYTVMVPTTEKRSGIRKVCRVVQDTEMRQVTVDEGEYVTETVEVPCTTTTARRGGLFARCRLRRDCGSSSGGCGTSCGDCGDCGPQTTTVCRKVWVAKLVTKEVPVTVCRQVVEDQPYEYNVTVCKPQLRTCKVRECSYETQTKTRMVRTCEYRTEMRTRQYQTCTMVPQQVTRDVRYTVCVAKTAQRTRPVTTCSMVPYEKQITYTVCVPHQVQKEVDVRVCRMVEKTISVPACGDGGSDACDDGCVKPRCRILGQRRAAKNCAVPSETAGEPCCE